MNFIKVDTDTNGKDIEVYYQDLGSGKPVVLIHGWPLSSSMWDYQLAHVGAELRIGETHLAVLDFGFQHRVRGPLPVARR